MKSQHLYIKNMVCPRCEMVVRQSLLELGVRLLRLELGHAEIERVQIAKFKQIETIFNEVGFELLYDREARLVEQIRTACREYLDNMENQLLITKLSVYIAINIGKNYSFLSKLFSKAEGMTIESYYLQLKMIRVKELLGYGELSLSEIALQLNYSSVQYLSSQFKKIEGYTVSDYIIRQKLA